MLKILFVTLRKLAIKENHFKGVGDMLGLVILNFAKRIREVKETITMLKY